MSAAGLIAVRLLPRADARLPYWRLELLRMLEQMPGFGIDFVRLNFAAPQSLDAVYLLA
jgi:hypothetical protein